MKTYFLRGLLLGLILAAPTFAESLAELEKIAAQAKTFDDFAGSIVLKERYLNALKKYQHRDRFRCESFDKIIAKAKTLADKIPGFADRLWEKIEPRYFEVAAYPSAKTSGPIQSAIKDTYGFRGVPRRFHALWNDPSLTGCYSDACEENDDGVPDRWAVTLKDSDLFYVEKNGIFVDQSILFVPLLKENKPYRLVVVGGGPGLLREVDVWDGRINKSRPQNLMKTAVEIMQHRYWKDQAPEMIVDKTARKIASIENDQKLSAPPEDFSVGDPMAGAIEKVQGRKCIADGKKGKPGASLVLGKKLDSPDALQKYGWSTPLSPVFNDVKALAGALNDKSFNDKLVSPYSLSPSDKELVDTSLSQLLLNNPNAATRAKAAMALDLMNRPDATKGFAERNSPYQPINININGNKNVADAFRKGLSDPDPAVQAASAIGAVDTLRPIPAHAFDALEKGLSGGGKGTSPAASAVPPVEMDRAADRGGLFSPSIDKAMGRNNDKGRNPNPPGNDPLDELHRLAHENRANFKRVEGLLNKIDDTVKPNTDRFRELTGTLTEMMKNNPWDGGVAAIIKSRDQKVMQQAVNAALGNLKTKSKDCDEKTASAKTSSASLFLPTEFCGLLGIAEAHAEEHERAIASEEGHANGQTYWQCGNAPSDEAKLPVSTPLQPFKAYFLQNPETKKCEWYLADHAGSIDRGNLLPGSYVSGKAFGMSDDSIFLYVPPLSSSDDHGEPYGWHRLCRGIFARDGEMGFGRKGIKWDAERDRFKTEDFNIAQAEGITVEEARARRREQYKRRRDLASAQSSSELLDMSKCTGSGQPSYCRWSPDQLARARACPVEELKRKYPELGSDESDPSVL